jgi:hypothetical protein
MGGLGGAAGRDGRSAVAGELCVEGDAMVGDVDHAG